MSVMSRPCDAAPVTYLAVDEAVDRPVRVPRDDDVDLVIHRLHNRRQRATRVVAVVDEPRVGRVRTAGPTDHAALVEQDDDRLDASSLEVRHERVHRRGFVEEVRPRRCR